MNQEEVQQVVQCLQQVLKPDNEARKAAEAQLNAAKMSDPNKYAGYLSSIINPANQIEEAVRSIAAVILRRNISVTSIDVQDANNKENNANLWARITAEARTFVKEQIIACLSSEATQAKNVIHKVCNLATEIQGAMQEHENEAIWQELLNLGFSLVNNEHPVDSKEHISRVDAGLQVFTGLFAYIIDHFSKHKEDLGNIFMKALTHKDLDLKLAALQATCNYLQICERQDAKPFKALLPQMTAVISQALAEDNEMVLEEALVEFNELAEVEPQFFKASFNDLYAGLKPICEKNDFDNNSIRHQPLEFIITLIERTPTVVKKDKTYACLKDLLESIFKIMIDIDEDIEESWLRPKEGYTLEEDEDDTNVKFGTGCVDRLVSCIGDEIMLPLIGALVTNTIANDSDWRYKNAGIMAFSQVGEYVDEAEKITAMIPTLIQHLAHPNPKIRYASAHAIGQLADDMPNDFQKAFHSTVIPALVLALDDSVPRVQAHVCAALTNFFEHATKEITLPYCETICQKLFSLIENGMSMLKENAATTLATCAEKTEEAFVPYFNQTLQMLSKYLTEFSQPEYKQFRGQVIEAITIICAAVGDEPFRAVADDVIKVLLNIQNNQTQVDNKDAQRIYLLSSWQRICLLMKADFAPYLAQVLPAVFKMATLNPTMGVSGQDKLANLVDVLAEVHNGEGDEENDRVANIVTDEIEEKDTAIQMLAVFIDECGAGFAPYVEETAKILVPMLNYNANDDIRASVAEALPGLVKAAKEAGATQEQLQAISKQFTDAIFKAAKEETATEVMQTQLTAMKDIIDEAGNGLFNQAEVTILADATVRMVEKSLERIEENRKLMKEQDEDEDCQEEAEEDDKQVFLDDIKQEYELQINVAEVMGILMKTHPTMVADLINTLRTKLLMEAFASQEMKRQKFGLFVLDDIVEHLGPNYFEPADYQVLVKTVCTFVDSKTSSLRQAAAYGVGVIAQSSGVEHFGAIMQECLTALKAGIEKQPTAAIKEKKMKLNQFNHARDNAIASLGKVIKYRQDALAADPAMASELLQYWLNCLPITHDLEECFGQVDYVAEFVLTNLNGLAAANPTGIAARLASIFGEYFDDKYFFWEEDQKCEKAKACKLKVAQAVQFIMNTPGPICDAFKAQCQNVLNAEARDNLTSAFGFTGQ